MRRSEEPVVLVEREGSGSVLWFLIGGAIGAGLALLFAPQSGAQTRRVVGRRLKKLRDAADHAEEAQRPAQQEFHYALIHRVIEDLGGWPALGQPGSSCSAPARSVC